MKPSKKVLDDIAFSSRINSTNRGERYEGVASPVKESFDTANTDHPFVFLSNISIFGSLAP